MEEKYLWRDHIRRSLPIFGGESSWRMTTLFLVVCAGAFWQMVESAPEWQSYNAWQKIISVADLFVILFGFWGACLYFSRWYDFIVVADDQITILRNSAFSFRRAREVVIPFAEITDTKAFNFHLWYGQGLRIQRMNENHFLPSAWVPWTTLQELDRTIEN